MRLQGRLAPTSGRRSATLGIVAQANGITPTTVQTVNLPSASDTFDTTVALGAGTWTLKAVYSDPSAVEGADSATKDVTSPPRSRRRGRSPRPRSPRRAPRCAWTCGAAARA